MRNVPYRRPGHLNIWSLAGGAIWGGLGCADLLNQDRYCEQESLKLHATSSSFLPCGCDWGCELCSSHLASPTWRTLSPSGTIAKINLIFSRKLLLAMVFYHCSIEAGNAMTETGAQKTTTSVCPLSEFPSLSIILALPSSSSKKRVNMCLWKLDNHTNDNSRSQSVLHPHIWEDLTSKRIQGRGDFLFGSGKRVSILQSCSSHGWFTLVPWMTFTSPERKKKMWPPWHQRARERKLEESWLRRAAVTKPGLQPEGTSNRPWGIIKWVLTPDRDSWEQTDQDDIWLYHEVLGLLCLFLLLILHDLGRTTLVHCFSKNQQT